MYDIKKYRMTYDHHTHTVYSHGKGTIEENVKAASMKGIKSIAITDHGPGHLTYGMKMKDLESMRRDIEEARLRYPEMEILLGVEANIVRKDNGLDVSPEDIKKFDIILAGYHYGITGAGCVGNYVYEHFLSSLTSERKLKILNTEMTLRAIYENPVNIITHPGDKGPFDIREIARACAEKGVLMEINAKHKHLTEEEIKLAAKYPVSFVIGSDAHIPSKVGCFEECLERAFSAGLEPDRIVNIKLEDAVV